MEIRLKCLSIGDIYSKGEIKDEYVEVTDADRVMYTLGYNVAGQRVLFHKEIGKGICREHGGVYCVFLPGG